MNACRLWQLLCLQMYIICFCHGDINTGQYFGSSSKNTPYAKVTFGKELCDCSVGTNLIMNYTMGGEMDTLVGGQDQADMLQIGSSVCEQKRYQKHWGKSLARKHKWAEGLTGDRV
jgi:hypothetical protein